MKKEYIKSLNAFKIEGSSGGNLGNMLKAENKYFDIGHLPPDQ